ncbi:MAG TPA: FAD-binding protein, partial [Candidatus Limnocylindrales bacterium]|nr:FAD-binding protein [Candidatus Limnocylindrales bacterium]
EEASQWVEALSEGRQTDARRPPELSTRDNVARAIFTEVREGRGSAHGGVYLDISYLPADLVRRKLPSMHEQFKELADVDITAGPMEVGPTCHYAMGGVRVDAETAATTRRGLFAAGEVAGGMHGANRLGGNSLSDLLVFGRRAGAGAAAYATEAPSVRQPNRRLVQRAQKELLAPFGRSATEDPYRLHAELQTMMQSLVGIFRAGSDLETALERIADLRERWTTAGVVGSPAYNPGWNLYLELESMLIVSEAVARSALQRTESRGAHARLDHPELDAAWGDRNSTVVLDGDQMRVTAEPLPPMPDDLHQLITA